MKPQVRMDHYSNHKNMSEEDFTNLVRKFLTRMKKFVPILEYVQQANPPQTHPSVSTAALIAKEAAKKMSDAISQSKEVLDILLRGTTLPGEILLVQEAQSNARYAQAERQAAEDMAAERISLRQRREREWAAEWAAEERERRKIRQERRAGDILSKNDIDIDTDTDTDDTDYDYSICKLRPRKRDSDLGAASTWRLRRGKKTISRFCGPRGKASVELGKATQACVRAHVPEMPHWHAFYRNNFMPQNNNILEFPIDATITKLYIWEGWCTGEYQGKRGSFPASYIKRFSRDRKWQKGKSKGKRGWKKHAAEKRSG
jgi:hypothetical protein